MPRFPIRRSLAALVLLCAAGGAAAAITNPILFVGQVPVIDDSVARKIDSAFGNQLPNVAAAPRGGALYIRMANGTLRDLTAEAGFGTATTLADPNKIAVRDPSIAFNASKAIFSMVVGAPTAPGGAENYTWQLYEVTNLQAVVQGQPALIALVPNQPAAYNNIYPSYASDGTILFVSDRPHNGAAHLYPLRDEYRTDFTTSGVWKLDAINNKLTLMQHSPSGSFRPFVDSYGRVLFSRWDHLEQDSNVTNATGGFDYASEALGAGTATAAELFPEALAAPPAANYNSFEFNQFFPWTTAQDGSGEEILNHLGRHDLKQSFGKSFTDDPKLVLFNAATSGRTNPNSILNLFVNAEDPLLPGKFYGVDTMEFNMHGAGQIVALSAPPTTNANNITLQYITNRATSVPVTAPGNIGHFRDPLPTTGGDLLAAYSTATGPENTSGAPIYNFRLFQLVPGGGGDYVPVAGALTTGTSRGTPVQYYDPNTLVTFSGALWELQPVEVVSHSVPPITAYPGVAAPEQGAFTQTNVLPADFLGFLKAQNLGVIVVRNATARDAADKQQPFNLHVPPTGVQTLSSAYVNGDKIYDIAAMQYFQGDMVRGAGTAGAPLPGRRAVPRPLNDPKTLQFNPADSAVASSAQTIFPDGSVALFVPARRALTWQSLSPTATPVIRERYWITVQPGEIRVCDGCHGVNQANQAGSPPAGNTAQALIALLSHWTQNDVPLLKDGFE